jgi:uncharacterized protein YcnI
MRRSLKLLLLTGLLLAVTAGPAFAHVTVDPSEVPQGSYQQLTFRVPNERDDSGTTRLEVVFPTDHPFASVRARPLPGWTVTVETAKLDTPVSGGEGGQITEAVSRVTWSGGLIKPGEYQDFDISAGPVPEGVDKLEFKALQTYQSGEVVRWIESVPEGGEEPEHPAPTLTVTAAEGDGHGATGAAAGAAPAGGATGEDVDAARTRGTIGIALGAVGLLLGAAALVLAVRRPRGSGT